MKNKLVLAQIFFGRNQALLKKAEITGGER